MQRLLLTGFLRFFPAFLRVFGSIFELLADDLRRVLRLIGEFLWRFAGLVSRYVGFAIDFLRRIPRWGEVQERMLDAIYWGWRPIELLWSPQVGRDGEMRWFVHAAIEKNPDRFRFTDNRELVYYDPLQNNEPQVLNSPEDWIQWLPCTSGSIDNPYGVAVYQKIWLPWYSKQRFFQLWAQGMERSMGIVTIKKNGPGAPTEDNSDA